MVPHVTADSLEDIPDDISVVLAGRGGGSGPRGGVEDDDGEAEEGDAEPEIPGIENDFRAEAEFQAAEGTQVRRQRCNPKNATLRAPKGLKP